MPQNFAMNDPIDLTNCDQEPIHIPNKIQPFGFLLVVDLQTFQVIQFSKIYFSISMKLRTVF